MRVPVWLTLGVAALVIVFGLYRLWLTTRPADERQRRRGLFGGARTTQALLGVVYLLLGGALVATSFGWNPMAGVFAPAPAKAPAEPGETQLKKAP